MTRKDCPMTVPAPSLLALFPIPEVRVVAQEA
jgi:hypothetical protein